MSVTWVQDADSNYEISSPDHLKQLMHKGTLYTDAGSYPANYWAVNYIQTVDIDLLGVSTDITPIGADGDPFSGDYDGNNYTISNWTLGQIRTHSGLFGSILDNTIKNVRLSGTFILEGGASSAGFLAGYGSNVMISNIECNFSTGTRLYLSSNRTNHLNRNKGGGVLGEMIDADRRFYIEGITLRGALEVDIGNKSLTGGVIGSAVGYTVRYIRNLATFTSLLDGSYSGGIIGRAVTCKCSFLLNAMMGDMNGQYVGGVVGDVYARDLSDLDHHTFVNAMTGNISGTLQHIGGVVGKYYWSSTNCHSFINYMTGDISGTHSSGSGGGIVGSASTFTSGLGLELPNSINAMNGNVQNSVANSVDEASINVNNFSVTVDTSFGLTFTDNTYGTTIPPSDLLTNSGFPDLPYVALIGTDLDGNTYDFDFVFANLAGNSSYPNYTHLILHKGDIHTPFDVDFDIPPDNTTVYLTHANVGTNIVTSALPVLNVQSGVTVVVPSFLDVEARSINIPVTVSPVAGAVSYRVTYQGPTGSEVTAFSGFTDLEKKNIVNLVPETQYTVRLYTDTGSGYELTESDTTTTLENTPSSYVMADFERNGVFDLTVFNDTALSDLSSTMDQLFATGDTVGLSVGTNPYLETSFIRVGETLSIEDVSGVLIPFDTDSGSGQSVTIVLADSSNVAVSYDESNSTISVDSSVYSPGDVFILDGRKVEVTDY